MESYQERRGINEMNIEMTDDERTGIWVMILFGMIGTTIYLGSVTDSWHGVYLGFIATIGVAIWSHFYLKRI